MFEGSQLKLITQSRCNNTNPSQSGAASFLWRFDANQWQNLLNSDHLHHIQSPPFNVGDFKFMLKAQRYSYENTMLRPSAYILMSLCLDAFPQNTAKINIGYNFETNPDEPFGDLISTSAYDQKGCILFESGSANNTREQVMALIDCEFNNGQWKGIPEMEMLLFRLKVLYSFDQNNEIQHLDLCDWSTYFPTFNASKLSDSEEYLEDIFRRMTDEERENNREAIMRLIKEMTKTIDFAHGIINIDHLREEKHIKQFSYGHVQTKLDYFTKLLC